MLWQVAALPEPGSSAAWPRASAPAGSAENCIAAIAALAMSGRWAEQVDNVLPEAVRILKSNGMGGRPA